MMNKKGSILIYGLMLSVTIIVLALALAYPVRQQIDITRGNDNLNCTSTLISNFDKATCLALDINIFYFIGGLIAVAGAVLGAKVIFG